MKLLVVSATAVAAVAAGLVGSVAFGDETAPRPGAETAEQARERQGPPAGIRAFVAAKKKWTTCVAEESSARGPDAGRFDPEAACGTKPRPDSAGVARGHDDEGERGKPPWAGGPDRRTAEPPGQVGKTREKARG